MKCPKKIVVIAIVLFFVPVRAQNIAPCPNFTPLTNTTSDEFTRQLVVDTYATLTCSFSTVCTRLLAGATPTSGSGSFKSVYRSNPTNVYDVAGNFLLLADLDADVVLQADDVTLDLNGFKITGLVTMEGNNGLIKNGVISAPAPVDAADALNPAVAMTGGNLTLLDCVVTCDQSPSGIRGRSGIKNFASFRGITIIQNCSIQAGDTTDASAGLGISALTGSNGNLIDIKNCLVRAGSTNQASSDDSGIGIISDFGGNIIDTIVYAGTSQLGNPPIGSQWGIGIAGDSNNIMGCTIITGFGGAGTVTGANGGIGISGNSNVIRSSWITTGSGGSGVTGGNGGIGVSGASNIVDDVVITTGQGGAGTTTGGNGGTGFVGSMSIQDSEIFTGAGGTGGTQGGNGGIGINGGNCVVNNLIIKTGSATHGGQGGTGVVVGGGAQSTVQNSIILTGPGSGVGADGIGIIVDGGESSVENTVIQNCIITTGTVNSGGADTQGIKVGNAVNTYIEGVRITITRGTGILVNSPAQSTFISQASISGGTVGLGTRTGTGISTQAGSTDTQILNSGINNMADGIIDNSTDSSSKIYRNFVYDIVTTDYSLLNESTSFADTGVSVYTASIPEYQNVFV